MSRVSKSIKWSDIQKVLDYSKRYTITKIPGFSTAIRRFLHFEAGKTSESTQIYVKLSHVSEHRKRYKKSDCLFDLYMYEYHPSVRFLNNHLEKLEVLVSQNLDQEELNFVEVIQILEKYIDEQKEYQEFSTVPVDIKGLYPYITDRNKSQTMINLTKFTIPRDEYLLNETLSHPQLVQRVGHSVCFSKQSQSFFIFGGYWNGKCTNDLFEYDLETDELHRVKVSSSSSSDTNVTLPQSSFHSLHCVDYLSYLFVRNTYDDKNNASYSSYQRKLRKENETKDIDLIVFGGRKNSGLLGGFIQIIRLIGTKGSRKVSSVVSVGPRTYYIYGHRGVFLPFTPLKIPKSDCQEAAKILFMGGTGNGNKPIYGSHLLTLQCRTSYSDFKNQPKDRHGRQITGRRYSSNSRLDARFFTSYTFGYEDITQRVFHNNNKEPDRNIPPEFSGHAMRIIQDRNQGNDILIMIHGGVSNPSPEMDMRNYIYVYNYSQSRWNERIWVSLPRLPLLSPFYKFVNFSDSIQVTETELKIDTSRRVQNNSDYYVSVKTNSEDLYFRRSMEVTLPLIHDKLYDLEFSLFDSEDKEEIYQKMKEKEEKRRNRKNKKKKWRKNKLIEDVKIIGGLEEKKSLRMEKYGKISGHAEFMLFDTCFVEIGFLKRGQELFFFGGGGKNDLCERFRIRTNEEYSSQMRQILHHLESGGSLYGDINNKNNNNINNNQEEEDEGESDDDDDDHTRFIFEAIKEQEEEETCVGGISVFEKATFYQKQMMEKYYTNLIRWYMIDTSNTENPKKIYHEFIFKYEFPKDGRPSYASVSDFVVHQHPKLMEFCHDHIIPSSSQNQVMIDCSQDPFLRTIRVRNLRIFFCFLHTGCLVFKNKKFSHSDLEQLYSLSERFEISILMNLMKSNVEISIGDILGFKEQFIVRSVNWFTQPIRLLEYVDNMKEGLISFNNKVGKIQLIMRVPSAENYQDDDVEEIMKSPVSSYIVHDDDFLNDMFSRSEDNNNNEEEDGNNKKEKEDRIREEFDGVVFPEDKLEELYIIHAHKTLLRMKSPFFEGMFPDIIKTDDDDDDVGGFIERKTNRVRINEEEISLKGLLIMIRFFYTNRLDDLTPQTCVSLYLIGRKFQVPQISAYLRRILKPSIDDDSVLPLLYIGDVCQDEEVLNFSTHYFCKNFERVFKSPQKRMEFVQLSQTVKSEISRCMIKFYQGELSGKYFKMRERVEKEVKEKLERMEDKE